MPPIDHQRILAFRLASHHLTERLGPGSLVAAAAACGIQERTVGSQLEVAVEPFGRLSRRAREEIHAEAERVALARGSCAAEVTFATKGT
jgi:hypothetical protein